MTIFDVAVLLVFHRQREGSYSMDICFWSGLASFMKVSHKKKSWPNYLHKPTKSNQKSENIETIHDKKPFEHRPTYNKKLASA